MTQPNLFDSGTPSIPVNVTVAPEEVVRLPKQSKAILERLKKGPTTNAELAQIGIRYSARIGELRAVGYDIEILDRNTETGLNLYGLK